MAVDYKKTSSKFTKSALDPQDILAQMFLQPSEKLKTNIAKRINNTKRTVRARDVGASVLLRGLIAHSHR
jgi:hypothetical protein